MWCFMTDRRSNWVRMVTSICTPFNCIQCIAYFQSCIIVKEVRLNKLRRCNNPTVVEGKIDCWKNCWSFSVVMLWKITKWFSCIKPHAAKIMPFWWASDDIHLTFPIKTNAQKITKFVYLCEPKTEKWNACSQNNIETID